jgi:ABC-type sugar transport system substrate-binding protein
MAVQESMLQTMASHVVAANTAWICLNRGLDNLDDLRTARSDLPIGLVMPDHVEAGRIQGRQVASLLPQGGHVLYVVGRSTNASTQQRARGFKEVMARLAPRIEIVGQIDGNWMATDAAVAVSRWMLVMLPAGLTVDAIVCQSDFMAAGVRNALRKSVGTEEVDFRRIPVLGCDGVDGMGKRLVDQGELASTVVMPITTGSALKAISAHYTQGVPFPGQLILPPLPYPDEAEMAQRWWQVA